MPTKPNFNKILFSNLLTVHVITACLVVASLGLFHSLDGISDYSKWVNLVSVGLTLMYLFLLIFYIFLTNQQYSFAKSEYNTLTAINPGYRQKLVRKARAQSKKTIHLAKKIDPEILELLSTRNLDVKTLKMVLNLAEQLGQQNGHNLSTRFHRTPKPTRNFSRGNTLGSVRGNRKKV